MKIFAERLKAEREALKQKDPKWTQEYLAELIGVARPTYTAYENGTKLPSMDTVNKLADIFDVDTDYLHGRTSTRKKVETNMSFFGGSKKYTPDEIAVMEATLKAYREQLKKMKNDEKK